jgi:hypothetical protein
MQQRRRVKHALTFEERLACQAERLRDEARKMPLGKQHDQVLKRARQAETALGITRWLTSPHHPEPPRSDTEDAYRNRPKSRDHGRATTNQTATLSHNLDLASCRLSDLVRVQR